MLYIFLYILISQFIAINIIGIGSYRLVVGIFTSIIYAYIVDFGIYYFNLHNYIGLYLTLIPIHLVYVGIKNNNLIKTAISNGQIDESMADFAIASSKKSMQKYTITAILYFMALSIFASSICEVDMNKKEVCHSFFYSYLGH